MGASNTATSLPQDADSTPIQVLAPDETSVSSQASIGSGNSRVALPANSEIVEVCVTANCLFKFGNSSVDATVGNSRALVAGVYTYKVPPGASYFAVTQVGGSTGIATVGRLH